MVWINKFNKQDDTKDEEEKDHDNTHKMLLELDNTDKEDKDKSEDYQRT